MTIPVPQRNGNKLIEDFYPLQKEELMALREVKLINNAAYVHLALRYENPFCDRPVEIIPKEFAFRWKIPESSVYKAIAKLKELGILNIKSGKLVIEWIIKSENKNSKLETEEVSELTVDAIAINELSDPAKNYQIQQKIIRSDNRLSDSAKNYQNRENCGLKPLSDIGSETFQTIQTLKTNQTEGGSKTFFQEEEQPKKEVVQEKVQEEDSKEEKKLVSLSESLEQISRDVVRKETKIISPSKKEVASFEAPSKACADRSADNRSREPEPEEIPDDLREKLQELEIPLDSKVLSAIARHDISQAYGAAAHVENTWETIDKPRSVFLYQLPKQPVEKRRASNYKPPEQVAREQGITIDWVKRMYPDQWEKVARHFGLI
jgi:hypothetical protein